MVKMMKADVTIQLESSCVRLYMPGIAGAIRVLVSASTGPEVFKSIFLVFDSNSRGIVISFEMVKFAVL